MTILDSHFMEGGYKTILETELGVRPFNAKVWFQDERTNFVSFDRNINNQATEPKSIASHFIPGWKGESLISKPAIRLKKILDALHVEALTQFNSFQNLNKSLKQKIYNEFLSFINQRDNKNHQLGSYNEFWNHLHDSNSPFHETLNNFKDVYCFQVATLYLYKIRFILQLCEVKQITPNLTIFLNPSSFLSTIFRKGSSKEILCDSLQSNQYSWFRPTENVHNQILLLGQVFSHVAITEMMKICTYEQSIDKSLKFYDKEYSHSLSHKAFGVFINDLILKLPQWLRRENDPHLSAPPFKKEGLPSVVNCKFEGNYLTSFTLSHWLAQEYEIDKKWDEIISPEFSGDEFANGDFIRLCHELQFLAYLVVIAKQQDYEPINFICHVTQKKNEALLLDSQISMFPASSEKHHHFYQRIILNASQLPKNNPHHNLTAQISSKISSLAPEGFLYVLTNQNFFVNSRSQKTEQLLSKLKLEAYFDFGTLKGRGEIPSYIYIFSKRSPRTKKRHLGEIYTTSMAKESCLTFKISGNLTIFNKYFNFVHELENFFINKSAFATPIYQKEIFDGLLFEYHQDAIVDGKLLHCTSQNSSQITHPNFFKNLTKSCIPLGNLFQIEHINPHIQRKSSDDFLTNALLNASIPTEKKHPLILIVNQTDIQSVKLEIIKSDNYQAKFEKYGAALFQYFGLTPKILDLNINLFKEFFSNNIGHQIIQLSLNEGTTKLKSKLQSLLIPKFFSSALALPEELEHGLNLLKNEQDDLLSTHPNEMINEFNDIVPIILSLSKDYPWHIMGLLSFFKHNVELCIEQFRSNNDDVSLIVNYNNPLIITPLLNLKSHHIYPNNPEVFVDILASAPQDIHLPLSYTDVKTSGGQTYLELYSQTEPIIAIYSDPTAISFMKYILSSATDISISSILESLTIPRIKELKEVINGFVEMNQSLTEIDKEVNKIISQLINGQISS